MTEIRREELIGLIAAGDNTVMKMAEALNVSPANRQLRTLLNELVVQGVIERKVHWGAPSTFEYIPGPFFDYVKSTLVDGASVYEVWVDGFAPVHDGGSPDKPRGLHAGHVWKQRSYGWVACPSRTDSKPDTWAEMVDRSVRHFRDQREASVFLWGYDRGIRQPAYEAALKKLPPFHRDAGESDAVR